MPARRTIIVALVLMSIALFSTVSGFLLEQPAEDMQKWLCEEEPALCDEEAVLNIRLQGKLVQTAGTAFFRRSIRHAISVFQKAFHLKSHEVRELEYLFESDPHAASEKLRKELSRRGMASREADSELPYFGFLPKVMGRVLPGNAAVVSNTKCFKKTIFTASIQPATGCMDISVSPSQSTGVPLCMDRWYFSVGGKTAKLDVMEAGKAYGACVNITAAGLADPSINWDAMTNGARIYRFDRDQLTRVLDTVDTILLFLPMITNKLDQKSAERNIVFIANYSKMLPAPAPRGHGIVDINVTEHIKNGDAFAKMELDGLGPFEGLGQGTTSGHFTFALWNDTTNTLYCCESIIPGVSCTEYHAWLAALQEIGNSVVHVPLGAEYQTKFNATAAWEWVNQNLGNEYGYHNFFFGWIDTESMNYPCMPWGICMEFDHVELVMYAVEKMVPSLFTTFFGQALNHRTGTKGLSMSQVMYTASKQMNMTGAQLLTVTEEDKWLYNATKRGMNGTYLVPSQVCSTLGCNTYKAAGVFDGIDRELQCTEMTVWDMFSLNIWDKTRMGSNRPAECIAADPTNELCQLCGPYTFNLMENFNTRAMWANMSEDCASRNPVPYIRTGCYEN